MKNRIITNLYLLIFIIGLVVGTIAINVLDRSYQEKINVTGEHYSQMISDISIDKGDVFKNGVKEYYKEFVVILFFNFFFFGNIYNYMFLAFKGMSVGMILSAYVLKYGLKGMGIYVTSIFPSYIIYVPAIVLVIISGLNVRNIVVENTRSNERFGLNAYGINDFARIAKKVAIYFVIALVLAVGISFIESYINIPIFRKCLEKA